MKKRFLALLLAVTMTISIPETMVNATELDGVSFAEEYAEEMEYVEEEEYTEEATTDETFFAEDSVSENTIETEDEAVADEEVSEDVVDESELEENSIEAYLREHNIVNGYVKEDKDSDETEDASVASETLGRAGASVHAAKYDPRPLGLICERDWKRSF